MTLINLLSPAEHGRFWFECWRRATDAVGRTMPPEWQRLDHRQQDLWIAFGKEAAAVTAPQQPPDPPEAREFLPARPRRKRK